jgi:hypothetical protein
VLFRLKATDGGTPKEEVEKIMTSQFYTRVHSAQLNEAEYAPLFAAGLLFLASKGVDAPYVATGAVVGNVGYYWLRAFVGNAQEGGMHPPPYAPFAIGRYVALGGMAMELWNATH